ncbi:MAG: TIGR03067 domain-containing protein [Natronospirillum sp.]|uniref:TIGR03067 domain-containing protein n=1 Tax=Natronospirillum sp. TaxID=2812955 RepID=UPI0025D05BB4|nr:TIGR03067 domain-containing protein [Natronospirillum sp.]MCH8551413.1 TIGR03067 domain-containing protein [Natronospirillum sp.]
MDSCLEGVWRQLAANEDGGIIDQFDDITLTVRGSAFTVRRNGEIEIEGSFEVNSKEQPTSIDWKDLVGADTGKVFKSVCTCRGNEFEFCAADEGLPRPTDFNGVKGHTIRRFKRIGD